MKLAVIISYRYRSIEHVIHSLWAPVLDDTSQIYLLGVVRYVAGQIVDDESEVTVRAATKDGGFHGGAERLKYGGNGGVIELFFEAPKRRIVVMLAITWYVMKGIIRYWKERR